MNRGSTHIIKDDVFYYKIIFLMELFSYLLYKNLHHCFTHMVTFINYHIPYIILVYTTNIVNTITTNTITSTQLV